MQQAQKRNEILGVFGRKGSGKTTLLRTIAARMPRVLVLDSKSDFGGGCIVESGAALRAYFAKVSSGREYHVIARPRSDEDMEAVMDVAANATDLVFVVDEIDRWCTPTKQHPALRHLVHYGRHQAVSLVAAARRPANVSRDFTAECDSLVCFAMREPRDLEYLASYMDVSRVPELPPLSYVTDGRSHILEVCGAA